jgi:hypothetical protein
MPKLMIYKTAYKEAVQTPARLVAIDARALLDGLCGSISQRHEPSKRLVMPLLCRPSNAGIGKAFPANFFGTVHIAQVDQDWRLKKIADATEVKGAESLPFRD